MGQIEKAGAGAPAALPAEGRLADILERAKATRQARTVEFPLIGEVVLAPASRADVAETITEDSDPEDDQLAMVAATVRDPAFTADEWGQFRDAAPLGIWGALVTEVMAVNGSTPEFVKEQARRFRA